MKTSKLTIALLFAFYLTISHAAVHISPSKTGSAIIVPFYTVSNQMYTMLSLNNTTDENKAVKIHFKEAKNGDLLTSFNVYLTGQDMWTMTTGQVVSTDGGKIKMVSSDQSCTIGFPNDEIIPTEEDWLWENGTIEIIEMGTINDIEALQAYNINCEALANHWQNDQMWSNNSEAQLSPATGGLHAEVTLMDVEQGHSANIPIIHMDDFFGEDSIQHTSAGDPLPNLSTGTKDSLVLVDGQAITTTWPTSYEAVSALLMKNTLVNEYNLETGVAAQTEWIVSFPTMFYHLDDEFSEKAPFRLKENNLIYFPDYYGEGFTFYNRDSTPEYYHCGGMTCPGFFNSGSINYSVTNLMMHSNQSNMYTESLMLTDFQTGNTKPTFVDFSWRGDNSSFHSGKIFINLSQNLGFSIINSRGNDNNNSAIAHNYHGLPVVGFAYTKFSNANAQPGLLAQYAFVREHYGEKKVIIGDAQ